MESMATRLVTSQSERRNGSGGQRGQREGGIGGVDKRPDERSMLARKRKVRTARQNEATAASRPRKDVRGMAYRRPSMNKLAASADKLNIMRAVNTLILARKLRFAPAVAAQ